MKFKKGTRLRFALVKYSNNANCEQIKERTDEILEGTVQFVLDSPYISQRHLIVKVDDEDFPFYVEFEDVVEVL